MISRIMKSQLTLGAVTRGVEMYVRVSFVFIISEKILSSLLIYKNDELSIWKMA